PTVARRIRHRARALRALARPGAPARRAGLRTPPLLSDREPRQRRGRAARPPVRLPPPTLARVRLTVDAALARRARARHPRAACAGGRAVRPRRRRGRCAATASPAGLRSEQT